MNQEKLDYHGNIIWINYSKIFKGIGPRPAIKINKRLRSTAGRAFISENPQYIDLAYCFLVEFPEDMLADTLPHEYAHIIAWNLFQDPGHGKGWKHVMRSYGLEPTRCHNYFDMRINREMSK